MRQYLPKSPGLDFISLGLVTGEDGHSILTDSLRNRHVYIEGVSGTGKTSMLKALLWQDIVRGYGFCVLDPVGSLVPDTIDFVGQLHLSISNKARSGRAGVDEWLRRERDLFLQRFDVLDFAKDDCGGFFFNPLEKEEGLTPNEIAGDFLRCLQRLIGDLNEMRRLQQVLRSAGALLCEAGGTLLDVPKLLRLPKEKLTDFITELDNRAVENGIKVRAEYARDYLGQFFANLTPRDKSERYESTLNALGVFLADDRVRRFVSQPKGNLNFPKILGDSRYLLVHLPRGTDMNTQKALGALIVNRVQLTAERRQTKEEIAKSFSLYADEFHFFFGIEWSEAIATVRNKGLNIVAAHQTDTQPPLHTEEGQALLRAFRQNASTHVYFRLGIEDAKNVAWAVFQPKGLTVKREWVEESISEQHTYSRSIAKGISKTIAEAFGESKGQTVSLGLSEQATYSESEGIGRIESKSLGLSISKGKNWSQTVAHSQGLSITQTESQTHVQSTGSASGSTEAQGSSTMRGSSSASSVSHNDGQGTFVTFNSGSGGSHQMGDIQAPMTTSSHDGQGRGASDTSSSSNSHADSVHEAQGNSYSNAVSNVFNQSKAVATGKGRAVGNQTSTTRGKSEGESESISASQSISEGLTTILSYAKGMSEGITRTVSEMKSRSHTVTSSSAESRVETEAESTGIGKSKTHKTEYYSVEEDSRISSYQLASCPPRHAFVLTQDKEIVQNEIVTHEIPQSFNVAFGKTNYSEDFLERARPHQVELVKTSVFERMELVKAKKNTAVKDSGVLD